MLKKAVTMLHLSSIDYKMAFLWLLSLCLLSSARGEYCIKGRQVPSYLYSKFDYVEEAMFPRDIRINMSLTKVSGTLLYSIDRNGNQLILTLYDSMEATLGVEINKHQFGVSLPQLCGCKMCRYEAFDLRVMVGETLQLQCNGGAVMRRVFRPSKGLNKDYILPYNDTESDTSSNNGAHLWLVNNPQYGNIYPNNDQLSGCIFKVSYRGRDLMFTNVSDNVGTECKKVCQGDICNGGQCFETYNGEPVCNCTSTFNNGIYCNDNIPVINARSSHPHHVFDAFKLSWRSTSREILILDNMNVKLTISQASGILRFEYQTYVGGGTVTRITLSEHYEPDKEYILIGTFYQRFISIQIYDNKTWNHRTLWTGSDMNYEVFTSVTLRSGDGVIGMAFKSSLQDIHWRNVSMYEYMSMDKYASMDKYLSIDTYVAPKEDRIQNLSNSVSKSPEYVSRTVIILASSVGVVSMIAIVLAVLLYVSRRHQIREQGYQGSPKESVESTSTSLRSTECSLPCEVYSLL